VVRRTQRSEELLEQRHVIGVELDELELLLLITAVVRQRVMRLGDADLRLSALRDVAAQHEREDARETRGERERQQLELQADVLRKRVGNADRRCGDLEIDVRAALRTLDAPFGLADI